MIGENITYGLVRGGIWVIFIGGYFLTAGFEAAHNHCPIMLYLEKHTQLDRQKHWERMWAPYPEPIYREVLRHIYPGDRVLDIGAGDLRLARRMAKRAKTVFAVDVNADLLIRAGRAASRDAGPNLHVICADARSFPFPPGITVAVLLMRHCTDFSHYRDKLIAAGCNRLITNARWRMGLEQLELSAEPVPFASVRIGWYACACGNIGFAPGPPVLLTNQVVETCTEVFGCPQCKRVESNG